MANLDMCATNGAQDLHENLLSIGAAAFPGLSNQNELNWTELNSQSSSSALANYEAQF